MGLPKSEQHPNKALLSCIWASQHFVQSLLLLHTNLIVVMIAALLSISRNLAVIGTVAVAIIEQMLPAWFPAEHPLYVRAPSVCMSTDYVSAPAAAVAI